MWEVDVELIEDWLRGVDDDTYDQVGAAIEILGKHGPGLGRPLVDSIVGSRHKNMKELRPGSAGRSEVRILFAFDPRRRAIMLLAGDKRGAWIKWYRKNGPSLTTGTTNTWHGCEKRRVGSEMAKTFQELLKERPGNSEARARHKERMLAEVRAYRLRELRELLAMTQTDVAETLAISQKRVSEIERGDVDRTKVDTLRRYADALGGTLCVAVQVGDETYQIA